MACRRDAGIGVGLAAGSGRVKAAVFPVPVWAAATSLPEQDGYRLFLDGGGLGVALLLYGAEQLGHKAEIKKLHAWTLRDACGLSRAAMRKQTLNDIQIGARPRLQARGARV